MPQTLAQPGVVLQWKAVGPFNSAPVATVSIKPHFPFGKGAGNTGSVVFPATNLNPSNASWLAVPLIGTFDVNGRLLGPDGYPLCVPALDGYSTDWLKSPTLYEIQIDLAGVSGQCGVFVAFQGIANNFSQGHSGVILSDPNASTSAFTGSGVTYTGTIYLGDTVVHPNLVNQSVYVATGGGNFTAVVNAINLATNTISATATTAQTAQASATLYWGSTVNLGVDLSQYVNWC
jgi:hypothetical protein